MEGTCSYSSCSGLRSAVKNFCGNNVAAFPKLLHVYIHTMNDGVVSGSSN